MSSPNATAHDGAPPIDRSESFYRTLFQNMREGVVRVEVVRDDNGAPVDLIVVDGNPAAEELFGLTRERAVGARASSFFGESPLFRTCLDVCSQVSSSRKTTRVEGYGALLDKHLSLTVVPLAGREVAVVADDITERKRSEEELSQSRGLIEAAFDGMTDAIMVIDSSSFKILDVNRAFLDLYGLQEPQVLGRTCYEVTHKCPVPCSEPEGHCPLADLRKLVPGVPVVHEHPSDDGSVRYVEVMALPIRGDHGGPSDRILHITRDITERKRLEGEAMHAQKMEMVGHLAGGVAHYFNNLLTVVLGFADLARSELPAGHSAVQDLKEIQKAGGRAADIARQMLAFASRQMLLPRRLNPNEFLERLRPSLLQIAGERVEVAFKLAPGLWDVKADSRAMEQIVLSVVENAAQAMAPGGGSLSIETGNVTRDVGSDDASDAAARECVALVVKDTGVGMTEEVKARAFEPFFTTRPVGSGTGLGLASVYGSVRQMDGCIKIESEVGTGTTVTIMLPRFDL